MDVVTCQSVRKSYGHFEAVRDLSLSVGRGEVLGLLGPNGAGKTTTIRLLCGLTCPTAGTATVLGIEPWTEWSKLRRRVGILIDARFPTYLTAHQQLRMACQVAGFPMTQADEMLELVGLSGAANKAIGTFSFGMTQRLGLAQALLGSPELLILDEPMVGLDPTGIAEIKAKLRGLAECGTTILFSSHQLKEVEELCSRIIFIDRGTIRYTGRVEDFQAVTAYLITVSDTGRAGQVLGSIGCNFRLVADDTIEVITSCGQAFADVQSQLLRSDVAVYHVEPLRKSLEDLFKTGGDQHVAATAG